MDWFAATSAIQKLAVLPSVVPVSTVSHVVISWPLAHVVPEKAWSQATTEARWIVPTRCLPGDGLSAVNVTVLDTPGYNVLADEPWRVTAELVPTAAVPVPEPVVVKYAYAAPASTTAPTTPRVRTFLRLRKDIKSPKSRGLR